MQPGDDLVKTCPECGRETTMLCILCDGAWICEECYWRIKAVPAAVAVERERCAKVAESCATKEGEDWNDNAGQGAWDSACDHIAERIRAVPKRAAGKD